MSAEMNQCLAKREKYWDEMTSDEKIERLARELAYLGDANQRLHEQMWAMERHEHGSAGKLVVPLHDSRIGDGSPRQFGRLWYALGLRKNGE